MDDAIIAASVIIAGSIVVAAVIIANRPGADTKQILEVIETMNQELQAAVSDLTAEISDLQGQAASILAFVQGVPALVTAAVTDALAASNVDEATAATQIAEATQGAKDAIAPIVDAINTKPATGDVPLPTPEPLPEPAPVDTGTTDTGEPPVDTGPGTI